MRVQCCVKLERWSWGRSILTCLNLCFVALHYGTWRKQSGREWDAEKREVEKDEGKGAVCICIYLLFIPEFYTYEIADFSLKLMGRG